MTIALTSLSFSAALHADLIASYNSLLSAFSLSVLFMVQISTTPPSGDEFSTSIRSTNRTLVNSLTYFIPHSIQFRLT